MHSDLTEVTPGTDKEEVDRSTKLKGLVDAKNGLLLDQDPALAEKANLPTGVFAVHVFGAQNLYFDATFPLEHSGMYVQIKVGSTTKCTSLQSPSKKGCIVWDDIKNFPATISPNVTHPFNKVAMAVIGYDKLLPIPKHKLLGKVEFHLHKLAKKQWSMETFQLKNRKKQAKKGNCEEELPKKPVGRLSAVCQLTNGQQLAVSRPTVGRQYVGDLQMELAFAYGSFGYGLCDQLESYQPPRYFLCQSAFPHLELSCTSSGSSSGVVFAPKRVSHPNFITFKKKVLNLEPQISPYFTKTGFTPIDTKSRPHLQPKLTRDLNLRSSTDTIKTQRLHQNIPLSKSEVADVHGALPVDPGSDSDDSSLQDLGEVTQFGLTEALAQMANLSFMAGAPELIQETEKQLSRQKSATSNKESRKGEISVPTADCLSDRSPLMHEHFTLVLGAVASRIEEGASLPGLSRHILSVGAEASGESPSQTVSSAANNDDQGTGDEDEMMAMTVSRGRRTAVFLSNSRKPIVSTSYEQDLA
ncbi:hypothetical protein P5673_014380 [Acropora cervicornis]|uniref:C2 domain-containing protein n=1 Tax=Acropora cervicornis TaxID=6130 RepID=A0AAD9QKM6_ACRCE|nr:hypothetical protein P5673_014380 [Acropora cervicornis]